MAAVAGGGGRRPFLAHMKHHAATASPDRCAHLKRPHAWLGVKQLYFQGRTDAFVDAALEFLLDGRGDLTTCWDATLLDLWRVLSVAEDSSSRELASGIATLAASVGMSPAMRCMMSLDAGEVTNRA